MQDEAVGAFTKVCVGVFGTGCASMAPHEVMSFAAGAATTVYMRAQLILLSPKLIETIKNWRRK